MRIAFLTPEFVTEPCYAGGLAQYLGRIGPALVERGHHVEVFVIADTHAKLDYKGVIVHRVVPEAWLPLRCVNLVLRILGCPRLADAQRICSIARALDTSLRARSLEVGFDIVQAASWLATGFFAVKNPVAPVVVRVSSYTPLCRAAQAEKMTLDKRLACYIELSAMRRACAVYAPSKFLADEIFIKTGLQVQVVRPPFYYPEDVSEDGSASEALEDWPRYLLFFGRVARYKGAGVLAEAIEPLLQKLPDIRLALAGPGSRTDAAADRLLRLASSSSEQVRYLGVLPPAKLRAVVRKAHAVVLPSLMDNLPNTCLEAMGLGKVVIGPKGVSFDELIVDGESGILFQLADPVSLRGAVLRAWGLSETERRYMGEAAMTRIAQMRPEVALDNLEKLYKIMISRSVVRGRSEY